MIRRLGGVVLVACALFAPAAADAGAEVPAGPRLTFIKTGHESDLVSSDPDGHDQQTIVPGSSQFSPSAFDSLTWSADGTRLVLGGSTQLDQGADENLYLAAADGSALTRLPGTADALYPTLSPDGRTVAFARLRQREADRSHRGKITVFSGVAVFMLDLESGAVRRLSPWRNSLFVFPTGFSPDGRTLLLTWERNSRRRPSRDEVVGFGLDGSGTRVLERDAGDATYSPDGSRLAMVVLGGRHTLHRRSGNTTYRSSELAVAAADGSGLRELTHTRALESAPRWDPSGHRLAYMQFPVPGNEGAFLGLGDSIMEINADGTCRSQVLSYANAILYGVTWQPGPGREVGPISC